MAPSGRAARRRRNILVVSDDVETRATISDAIAALGDLIEAPSPASALAILATPARRIDLIIVECLRPSERSTYAAGVDFIRKTFARWPWIPVLTLCGPAEAQQLAGDVLLTGVRGVLLRPLGGGGVRRLVTRVLRRNQSLRHSPRTVGTMQNIVARLADNLFDVPSLDELAAATGMSRSHLSRTFHSVHGMPLRDYVRELRLKHAHDLLITSRLSLTAVAIESGFYDLPHFDKAFRERLGVSPRAFRSRHAGGAAP